MLIVSDAHFTEKADWGKWGAYFTFELPSRTDTNAKATNAAEQSKSTTRLDSMLSSSLYLPFLPQADPPVRSVAWSNRRLQFAH